MSISKFLDLHKKWLNDEPGGERADFSGADLSDTDFSGANLIEANLCGGDFRGANFRGANLRGADLTDADLGGANLSEAEGLLFASDYLIENFERTDEGFIAYKTFGVEHIPPKKWVIEPGSIITENVNFDRCRECGCGINVAPLKWVKHHYGGGDYDIWKVLIRFEWLAGVCVPYHTWGVIRCERVQIIEIVKGV